VRTKIRYSYRNSIKSSVSDELINTYLLRPAAGLIVWALFYTPITPNQVTFASIIAGFAAALVYAQGTPDALFAAGLLVTLKDLLDSADGQLARAKRQYSRIGRFLDSIGDFIVDAAIFGVFGWLLYRLEGNPWMFLLAFLGFLGISFRVSYHVFYHAHYLHLQSTYANNRITEEVREEDVKKGGWELMLQRLFQLLYGWQDRLVMRIDAWTARIRLHTASCDSLIRRNQKFVRRWYSDLTGLRLSGFLGFGTELIILTICSLFNELETYLYINLFLMNGVLIACVIYRRAILFPRLQRGG
jgi:phosphatidylglycerophosphate synthase